MNKSIEPERNALPLACKSCYSEALVPHVIRICQLRVAGGGPNELTKRWYDRHEAKPVWSAIKRAPSESARPSPSESGLPRRTGGSCFGNLHQSDLTTPISASTIMHLVRPQPPPKSNDVRYSRTVRLNTARLKTERTGRQTGPAFARVVPIDWFRI